MNRFNNNTFSNNWSPRLRGLGRSGLLCKSCVHHDTEKPPRQKEVYTGTTCTYGSPSQSTISSHSIVHHQRLHLSGSSWSGFIKAKNWLCFPVCYIWTKIRLYNNLQLEIYLTFFQLKMYTVTKNLLSAETCLLYWKEVQAVESTEASSVLCARHASTLTKLKESVIFRICIYDYNFYQIENWQSATPNK